ncbi:MAG: bifunctional precorrin-2 dehydrogenase/sirohydrochlorin ferrochelatase [Vicinamibacterales bacterium]
MGADTSLFPVFLKLESVSVLVVGAGPVAASKLEALLAAGARVTVVAPDVCAEIESRPVTILRREFQESDLDDVWFVVSAATPAVNRAVSLAAATRRLFVNAVDDPGAATAYLGGVVRRSDLTIAISTSGRAPALAGLVREALDEVLPDDMAVWFARADELKQTWRATGVPMSERRPQLAAVLARRYCGTLSCCRELKDEPA